MAAHTGGEARILSSNPGVYLYTERQTAPLIILPIHWYRQDLPQLLAPFRNLSTYASISGLSYVYFHRSDYGSLSPGHGEEANASSTSGRYFAAVKERCIKLFGLDCISRVHRSMRQ